MAARGTTFAKQDRDRAKKAKAAEKRERRQNRSTQEPSDDIIDITTTEELSPAQLLKLVEQLHEGFADGSISFEDFEARKTELMERIAAL